MRVPRIRVLPLFLLLASAIPGACSCAQGGPETSPAARPREVAPPAALGSDEQSTIQVFQSASRSVVFITTSALRRDFWSLNVFEVPRGSGSGFIWDTGGHIVTNFHVIAGANRITVVTADRAEYPAKVAGVDPDHDLAVLRITAPEKDLVPVTVGSSKDLKVGQKTLAIGNPFGLDHSLSTGVVSALGRTIRSMNDRTIEGVIQTDAAVNPGNSGGPLLDGSGRLIGVNTQIVSPSGAFAGISFAVPVDMVNRVVPQLIAYGKIIKPGLGVSVLQDGIAARYGIEGIVLMRIAQGGAAHRAGLKGAIYTEDGEILGLGDVIIAIEGEKVVTLDDMQTILDRYKPGDRVTVEYTRDGKKLQATVTLQELEQ